MAFMNHQEKEITEPVSFKQLRTQFQKALECLHDERVNMNDPDLTVPNEAYVVLGLHL